MNRSPKRWPRGALALRMALGGSLACIDGELPTQGTSDSDSSECPTADECTEICGIDRLLECSCEQGAVCEVSGDDGDGDGFDEGTPDDTHDDACSDVDIVAQYPFSGNAHDQGEGAYHGVVSGATLTRDRHGRPDSAYELTALGDSIDFGDVFNDLTPPASISIRQLAMPTRGCASGRDQPPRTRDCAPGPGLVASGGTPISTLPSNSSMTRWMRSGSTTAKYSTNMVIVNVNTGTVR